MQAFTGGVRREARKGWKKNSRRVVLIKTRKRDGRREEW